MQTISIGDNLQETSKPVFWKKTTKKTKTSKCGLLKFLSSVLSINPVNKADEKAELSTHLVSMHTCNSQMLFLPQPPSHPTSDSSSPHTQTIPPSTAFTEKIPIFTLKAPSKVCSRRHSKILIVFSSFFFFYYFQRKCLNISCESSAWQMIHMKSSLIFSEK